MLSYARKQEKRLAKEALEKQLLPLWLIDYAVSRINGEMPTMNPQEFLEKALIPDNAPEEHVGKSERTAEDIKADFMRLVEIDKMKGG